MCHNIKRFAVLLAVPLLLGACLPGESETKKSLERTAQAATTIQAEQAAASMINTATRLVMSEDGGSVNSADLKAFVCGEKVIAYIPRTAKIARNAELPLPVAQHMRSYLESKLGKDRVLAASDNNSQSGQSLTGGGDQCGHYAEIATNSPIIVMNMNMAQTIQTPENEDGIVAISMMPCAGDLPGVIIKRTHADGTEQTEEHCGTAAPTDLPDIITTTGQIADWQKRLAGDATATRNVLCIASDNGCTPVAEDMGTQIQCNTEDDQIEYIANPLFDTSDYTFKPDPNDVSCGRGWVGELTARVKSKVCTITRNGVQEEQPAKVFDIAYIGAQCQKQSVLIHDTCPAGYPNSDAGRVVSLQDITMLRPITLSPTLDPTQGVNHSEMAYRTDTGETNISDETEALITLSQQGGVTVKRSNGTSNNFKLFYSSTNLNQAEMTFENGGNPSIVFDSNFAQEIANQANEGEEPAGNFLPVVCYGAAQTCKNGIVPEMMAVVVDRSGSMVNNAANANNILPKQTFCRATMANLFYEQPRMNACKAAKEWHQLINNNNYKAKRLELLSSVPAAIANGRDPVDYIASDLYPQLIAHICEQEGGTNCSDPANMYSSIQHDLGSTGEHASLVAKLNSKLTQMRLAMRSANTFLPRAKYGLMIGHDCYPEKVRDDSYGTCAPTFASYEQLQASDYTSSPLKTCQSTCPGECVTDAVERSPEFVQSGYDIYPTSLNEPVRYNGKFMHLIDSFVQSNLIPNLPYGIKFYYSEFISNMQDTHPIFFRLGDATSEGSSPDQNSQNQSVDMSHWIRELYKLMKVKFETRDAEHSYDAAGNLRPLVNGFPRGYANGGTPLYKAIDNAIDQLRDNLFQHDSDAAAALVILTDGQATDMSGSSYFSSICNIGHESNGKRSLVEYIGNNYPNLKLYYLYLGNAGTGDIAQCQLEANQSFNGTKIVHAFNYDANAADSIHNAFNTIAGSADTLPPEIVLSVSG